MRINSVDRRRMFSNHSRVKASFGKTSAGSILMRNLFLALPLLAAASFAPHTATAADFGGGECCEERGAVIEEYDEPVYYGRRYYGPAYYGPRFYRPYPYYAGYYPYRWGGGPRWRGGHGWHGGGRAGTVRRPSGMAPTAVIARLSDDHFCDSVPTRCCREAAWRQPQPSLSSSRPGPHFQALAGTASDRAA